jgi:dihydroxy-acid dehydratase
METMADKRDLDAKKREQWQRLVRFGEHMKERRERGESVPQWQCNAHPAYPVVYDILRMDGLTTEDLDKPLLGVANSFSEVTPGHLHFRTLADCAKQGIREMGGVPMEFGTGAPCDAFGNANPGYRYILPMRENIADTVELMAQAHHFDGMLLISSCDKINPAMLMGAARVNRPAVFLGGGMGHNMCPGVGLGTALTMQVLAEAMGMALFHTATTFATDHPHRQLAQESGAALVNLVRRGIRPSDIMTREAFENALRVNMAIGGSINSFIHVPAIANELGIAITAQDFDRISDATPYLCNLQPNGPWNLEDLEAVGGIAAVMKVLEPLLHTEVVTVTGRSLKEELADVRVNWDARADPNVLRPLDDPILPTGGLNLLHGSLAPDGAVVRTGGVPRSMFVFEGPARVWDSEVAALDDISERKYREGEVLVIRYEGVIGGPGMPEQGPMGWTLQAHGMFGKLWLVTDGRYSGNSTGPLVGMVTPEAALGGPIAVVRTGDRIRIDLHHKRIDLLVGEAEIRSRLAAWTAPEPRIHSGYMERYLKLVQPALQGAVLRVR